MLSCLYAANLFTYVSRCVDKNKVIYVYIYIYIYIYTDKAADADRMLWEVGGWEGILETLLDITRTH